MENSKITDADGVIRVYNSKIKYGFLGLLSFAAAGTAAHTALTSGHSDISTMLVQYGAAAIAIIIGMVLIKLGFAKEPTLVIDQHGVTCARPDMGLIPWEAIVGLGMSKASIVRGVLLIAIEPSAASEEQQIRWTKHITSGFLNPSVSNFQRQIQAKITIQVPISFLAISGKKLKAEIEKKVHRDDNNGAVL